MEAWLYRPPARADPRLDQGGARRTCANVSGEDYDAKYASTLEKVRADSQFGSKLGVNGTPTFYLNGIKLPSVRTAHLEEAFVYELQKARSLRNPSGGPSGPPLRLRPRRAETYG